MTFLELAPLLEIWQTVKVAVDELCLEDPVSLVLDSVATLKIRDNGLL